MHKSLYAAVNGCFCESYWQGDYPSPVRLAHPFLQQPTESAMLHPYFHTTPKRLNQTLPPEKVFYIFSVHYKPSMRRGVFR